MSANNQIIISKSSFKVYHIDVDLGLNKDDLIGQGKTIEEAIEIAERFEKKAIEDGYEVEYGIKFY